MRRYFVIAALLLTDVGCKPRPQEANEGSGGVACGNGVVEAGETCDDGNTLTETCAYGETACEVCGPTCQLASGAVSYCGDGTVDRAASEECDDGNTVTEACAYGARACDICRFDCQRVVGAVSYCGDGLVDAAAGEGCDDGAANGASCEYSLSSCLVCSTSCQWAAGTTSSCGDGVTNGLAGEICDDGGDSPRCNQDCTAAACGDGYANAAAGEVCDDAGESAWCNSDCSLDVCGDGIINRSSRESCELPGSVEFANSYCDDTCVLRCDQYFADCNQEGSDGCEVHLDYDDNNCGFCGVACEGQSCVGGVCGAEVILPNSNWLDLTSAIENISLDETHVYWADRIDSSTRVRRAPKDLSSPPEVLSERNLAVGMVLVDDAHVYWTGYMPSELVRMPKAGGPVEVLVESADQPVRFALDATHLYWAVAGYSPDIPGSVDLLMRLPKAGGVAEQVAEVPGHVWDVLVDDTHAYMNLRYHVARVSKSATGGAVEHTICNNSWRIVAMALDASSVYCADETDRLDFAKDDKGGGVRVFLDGPVNGGGLAFTMVVDGGHLYAAYGERIDQIPTTGEPFSRLLLSPGRHIVAMALDSSHIYWGGTSGLMRVAR